MYFHKVYLSYIAIVDTIFGYSLWYFTVHDTIGTDISQEEDIPLIWSNNVYIHCMET